MEDVRYRPANIFIDVINDEYNSKVNPNYEDQDGGEDDEDEDDYEEDEYYEEEPPLSGGDEVATKDRFKHGESSHAYMTRSFAVTTIDINIHNQREASTSSLPPRED